MVKEEKCFELKYKCPFPSERRDPNHCLVCTQVLINIYHVKNYALTTVAAVKEALSNFSVTPEEKKKNEIFSDVV